MKSRKKPADRPKIADVVRSTGTEGLEFGARRAQRLKTLEILRRGRTPLSLVELADHGADFADRSITDAHRKNPPRPPSACREGCAWCCHKRVGISAVEALRIATFLKETLPSADLHAVRDKVVERDAERKSKAKDRWQASRVACPFLANDRCSIYHVRPLTCRGYNSSDVRRCELDVTRRERTDVPVNEMQLRLANFILDGTRAGLAEAGLDGELLELCAALRIALSEPEAQHRFLAGEAVFAAAKMP